MDNVWISIDDKKPEDRTMVIAHCSPLYGDEYVTGCWYESGEFYDQGRTVTVKNWKNMPKVPIKQKVK